MLGWVRRLLGLTIVVVPTIAMCQLVHGGVHWNIPEQQLQDAAGRSEYRPSERGRYGPFAEGYCPPERGEGVGEGFADVDDAEAVTPYVVGRVEGILNVQRIESHLERGTRERGEGEGRGRGTRERDEGEGRGRGHQC